MAATLQAIRDGALEPTRFVAADASQRGAERLWKAERQAWTAWYLTTRRVRQNNPSAWGSACPLATPTGPTIAWPGWPQPGLRARALRRRGPAHRAEYETTLSYPTFGGVTVSPS